MKACWTALVFAWVAGVAHGQTSIQVTGQRYITDLGVAASTVDPATNEPTTTFSAAQFQQSSKPLDNTLQRDSLLSAQGSASPFSVSASTSGFFDRAAAETDASARADAQSQLSFRVLQDQATPLTFSILGGGIPFFGGYFSLYDSTTSAYVFSYTWLGGPSVGYPAPAGSLPLALSNPFQSSISLEPYLFASHQYKLVLHASSNANVDNQFVSLSVLGLTTIAAPVPEPSAVLLTALGLMGVAIVSRRRNAKNRPLVANVG